MPADNSNSNGFFKMMSVLHAALVIGIVIFGTIVTALTTYGTIKLDDAGLLPVFSFLVPAVAIAGAVAGNVIFKKKLNEINNLGDLDSKLNNYRAALIMKYALYEGPALFSIIAVLLTADVRFLAITVILVLLMLYARPGIQKTATDLSLNEQDMVLLENLG